MSEQQDWSSPISREQMETSLAEHLVQRLHLPVNGEEEKLAMVHVARECLNYFSESYAGMPENASQILLWITFSALWQNKFSQQQITEFFTSVNLDLLKVFHAWNMFTPEEKKQGISVALIPGKLTEADIYTVVSSLFNSNAKGVK
jgi:hypothetical protein